MIQRALLLWLLFGSAAYSQSKVGTTGAQFLELPLSARSAGMGDIGTVLMDSRSYHTNPATLGFFQPGRISIQLDPVVSGYYTNIHFYSISAASMVRDGKSGGPSIGVGVRYFRLSSGPMVERTYNQAVDFPVGTGRTFAWTDAKAGFAVGLGWSGKVDFGVGAGLNYIRESAHVYHTDTWCSDLGIHLGVALRTDDGSSFRPPRMLIGASLVNVGPELKFFEKGAPFPKSGLIGVGCKFVWRGGSRDVLTLFPAIEYCHLFADDSFEDWRLGLEVWAKELICVRVGHISSDGADNDQTTYGLGFSTAGLRGSSSDGNIESSGGVFDFILNNVDVQLSFAHQSSIIDGWDGTDYYGIELMF